MSKNTDKGVSLKQKIDPSRQDNQHQPKLAMLKLGQKISSRIGYEQGHQGNDTCVKYRIKAHFQIGQILRREINPIVFQRELPFDIKE